MVAGEKEKNQKIREVVVLEVDHSEVQWARRSVVQEALETLVDFLVTFSEVVATSKEDLE